jgi:glycosyltransferase involved in cell wall biosynthesis/MoaA/NifB/PqqE/SkfB family radical SAM enzyme
MTPKAHFVTLSSDTVMPDEPMRPISCHRPWTGFEVVDHLGDVRPCCWGKLSCGNLNSQTPEEIWQGPGFQFYRSQMAAGNLSAICNQWCPILQGCYSEATRLQLSTQDIRASVGRQTASPEYLRVVPTTACNLKCPMCYQADSPPTMLPLDLFARLQPWLQNARELLVLGGETFLARQCLEWIERINPQEYPHLRLAAITNGLGFSRAAELIGSRKWSWILVSIDAASPNVFAKVRGGDFHELVRGLDMLATIRADSLADFEIRFGFTLQKSNLSDVMAFVDLCADYRAMPQFTLVFGEWHGEAPSTRQDYLRFLAVLEKLDKRLWERGFGRQIVSPALAALRLRHGHLMRVLTTRSEANNMPVANSGSENIRMQVRVADQCPAIECSVDGDGHGRHHLSITVWDRTKGFEECLSRLGHRQIETYSISVPFFDSKENALSALRVWKTIDSIKKTAARRQWRFLPAPVDLTCLGFDPADSVLDFDTVCRFGTASRCALSIISPVFNRRMELSYFIRSVGEQIVQAPIELILVDDASTDDSVLVAQDTITELAPKLCSTLLKRHRRGTYVKGTFTFGAGIARQIGINIASGERVVFLDPDQIVNPGCLNEHLQWGRLGFDVVVGDREEEGVDLNPEWQALRTEALSIRNDWWLSFFTGNSSVDRQMVLRAGGFDPTFQYWGLDDTDLGFRLHKAGASVWHTRRASVLHLDPNGTGGGCTDEERYWSYRVHMEVLYRKYLSSEILKAFRFVWEGN